MRPPNSQKLAKLTLKLIEKDLKRISSFKVEREGADGKTNQVDPPPGIFASTLARYLSVLLNHKKTTEKLEDDERAYLKKLSTKELKKLAGVE